MTKERRAQMLTVLILGTTLSFLIYQKSAWPTAAAGPAPKQDPTPQDAIYAMLDAAREGNVNLYLNAHTGQMADVLRKAIADQGQTAFAQSLRTANAPVKAIAVQQPTVLMERESKVKVEYVFADRNETQWMYLERENKEWKIARVDAAERSQTLVPYGTPVR